ncbi:MAG: hypothetical protein KGP35_07620 [Bacteroidetes bacterium]|nr:hypothetical protein [Bacteroidota bacterium]
MQTADTNGHDNLTTEKEAHAHNKGLPKAGVTSFYDSFVLNRTLVFQMNGSAETPRLRQAPNRYKQALKKTKAKDMTKINTLFFILFIGIIYTSCQMKKKYYYREGSKEEIIEAYSDSAAYLEAFKKFQISKKVHDDMKKAYGNTYLSAPINFELLNEKHEDITYKIYFAKKDSLENNLKQSISGMPNNIEESITKIREEKNGVGAKYDTGGLYLAPVKVLSAKFVTKEYSNYKDVSLRYKNISEKVITAIRFKWYGENAFNEPADMGGLIDGWGGGFTDDALKPGTSEYGEWSVLSRDGKKILIAYPYEVVFKDGSKWELSQ